MVILFACDDRLINTNTIARNTLREVNREVKEANRGIQKVNQGVEELKSDSAAQKAHEKGELLTALHLRPIHARIDKERREFLRWMNTVFCDDNHGICHGQRNLGTAGYTVKIKHNTH
jgi:hypothetical protein